MARKNGFKKLGKLSEEVLKISQKYEETQAELEKEKNKSFEKIGRKYMEMHGLDPDQARDFSKAMELLEQPSNESEATVGVENHG